MKICGFSQLFHNLIKNVMKNAETEAKSEGAPDAAAQSRHDSADENLSFIAKGSFWQLSSSIISKLIAFVYVVYLARVLPQEEVGLFYLALSFVSVISIFADLGISMTAPRYIPYFMEKGSQEKSEGW